MISSQVPPNPKAAPLSDVTVAQNSDSQGQLGRIPPRDRQVADLVAEGRTDKEISAMLGLSPGTAKVYLARIYRKLGISGKGSPRVLLARMVWQGRV